MGEITSANGIILMHLFTRRNSIHLAICVYLFTMIGSSPARAQTDNRLDCIRIEDSDTVLLIDTVNHSARRFPRLYGITEPYIQQASPNGHALASVWQVSTSSTQPENKRVALYIGTQENPRTLLIEDDFADSIENSGSDSPLYNVIALFWTQNGQSLIYSRFASDNKTHLTFIRADGTGRHDVEVDTDATLFNWSPDRAYFTILGKNLTVWSVAERRPVFSKLNFG